MEGIVLRQIKTLNSRRMLLLFTGEKGKISAGTSVNEKGRNKSALALRPFALSNFDIRENKGYLNIAGGETINSHYKIGEDLDKFANASFVLEVTEKMLPEDMPQPKLFDLLKSYLGILESRKRSFETITVAFLIKALQVGGVTPHLEGCLECGQIKKAVFFNVEDAGYVCCNCSENLDINGSHKLLYKVNFDIVNVLTFFMNNPMEKIIGLELKPKVANELLIIMKNYVAFHLDIGSLKSESLLNL